LLASHADLPQMNDYQSHFQNYSQTLDSSSAMHLAYYQSTHPENPLHDSSYATGRTQSWHGQKGGYIDQPRIPTPNVPLQHNDSLLYASEFAEPHSNLELAGHDLNMPYPAYSSASGYPVTLDATHPEGLYHLHETVASSSQISPEPMYSSLPVLAPSSARHDIEMSPDSFSLLSWQSSNPFQAPSLSDAPPVRYSPYTVKSQRRTSQDGDTPPSPLSLARSKHSSTSPSPGPLTPAIGHISLQTELCTVGLESRPSSQGSSRNLYGRVSLQCLKLFDVI
jgi:hypothetical protein